MGVFNELLFGAEQLSARAGIFIPGGCCNGFRGLTTGSVSFSGRRVRTFEFIFIVGS
jgi:hypothetical protein